MKNITKKIKKITALILLTMFLIIVSFTESDAASLENTTQEISVGSEIEYKINFGEKLSAIDLVLTFEEEKLSIMELLTENAEYNQIENGKIVLVYVDESGEGTDNISIKFKTKELTEENTSTKIKVESINAYSLENERGYEDSELNIELLIQDIIIVDKTIEQPKEENENINNKTGNLINEKEEENTSASNGLLRLPNTGTNTGISIAIIIAIVVAIIAAILIVKNKKIKGIMPIILLGILFIGTVKTEATSGIFIKKYENTKNYEKLIVVMPDQTNRNLKRDVFEKEIQKSISVKEIVNSENEKIDNNGLVGTGSKVITEEKDYRVIVYGDINGDGKVNSNDIGLIIKEKVNDEKIEGINRKAANVCNVEDVDDEIVNSEDINRLKNYILRKLDINLVDELPEEYPGEVMLNATNMTLDLSETKTAILTATVTPDSAANKAVTWTSSDTGIATVDASGKVTAVANGTATITASTVNGKKAECTVTVQTSPTKVELNSTSLTLDLSETKTVILTATIIPNSATNKAVTWTSSDTEIATVDTSGKVTAVANGTATITASTVNGHTARCQVTVQTEGNIIRILRDYDCKSVENYNDAAKQEESNPLAWTAAPCPVEFNGKIYFYFRGKKKIGDNFDASLPYVCYFDPNKEEDFDGTNWTDYKVEPILDLGYEEEGEEKYDTKDITALAACVYNNKVYLFYRGVDMDGNYTLMYATSKEDDALTFEKQGSVKKDGHNNDYFNGATVVSVYTIENRIYMTYMGRDDNGKLGDCYLTYSDDGGESWEEGTRILSHGDDDWTSSALDTFRMYADDEYLYVFFGAGSQYFDYPEGIGIARAPLPTEYDKSNKYNPLMDKDKWEIYPYNPIMIRGASGAADEGAVWSFTPFKYKDKIICFYEGYGSIDSYQGSDDSLKVREEYYGGSTKGDIATSNIMACELNTSNLISSWDEKPITGQIKLRNVNTGEYLTYDTECNIFTSDEGSVFTLSFENNFFRIEGKSNVYVTPEINNDSSTAVYDYNANFDSSLVMSDLDENYRSLRGFEWELYPVQENCYKIQNRWTGCFMNISGGRVNQSQETNDSTMLWQIEITQQN